MERLEKIIPCQVIRHQGINPEGDCAPCCLATITGKTVQEIYDLHGRVDGLAYMDIIRILGLLGIQYENFLPSDNRWSENPEYFPMGRPSYHNFIQWYELTKQRINRGLIGLSPCNMNGDAHTEDILDHFVLIHGYEQESQAAKDKIVLISCPTKGEYKKDAKEFLWHFGGYNAIWIKPNGRTPEAKPIPDESYFLNKK